MGTNCAAWLDTKLHYSVLSAQFKSQSRELEWGCRREQEGSVKPPEQTPALACCRGGHQAERSHSLVGLARARREGSVIPHNRVRATLIMLPPKQAIGEADSGDQGNN
ncbi:hypothetical protein AMTR_s00013p00031020 [Amborella trichopoda]|uniref:Uncharacterized protein n=1 Tax=Amborella trichopoda TaxID=13333 RepID=W1PRG0_AMBTC|nr:hypothetical protein AMTR_s00013p00031020 [Amborella trichopoda]